MQVRVRIVARSGEEPRLDPAALSAALDSTRTFEPPHVAKATAEQPTLAAVLRELAKRSQAPIHGRGIDAHTVVRTAHFEAPRPQSRDAQRPHLRPPPREERRIRRTEAQLDPTARTSARGDGRVRVRDELGHDLDQIDAALREVFAKVPAPNCADTHCLPRQHLRHGGAAYPAA